MKWTLLPLISALLLSACSSQASLPVSSLLPSRVSAPDDTPGGMTSKARQTGPLLQCHPFQRFVKRAQFIRQHGIHTSRAGQARNAFQYFTVYNAFRINVIKAYPLGGSKGSLVLTVLPGQTIGENVPATKGITVELAQPFVGGGPGVRINARSCSQ